MQIIAAVLYNQDMLESQNFLTEYQAQTIDESYKHWLSNTPSLYSTLSITTLPASISTFQWIPQRTLTQDGSEVICRCLIGTSGLENNSLVSLKTIIPIQTSTSNFVDPNEAELGKKVTVENTISQNSSVLVARVNPIKTSLVASWCGGGYPEMNVYDLSDTAGEYQEPLIRLEGGRQEGTGLDWNRQKHNLLISGSKDSKICIWDIEQSKETDSVLKPLREFELHKGGVRDVCWNKKNPNVFLSGGQDSLLAIWDTRDRKKSTPQFQKIGHSGPVTTIDFSHHSQMLFISGGQDTEVGLWDLRNISKRIHTFAGHSEKINKVQWCPQNRHLLASCSADRRIVIWDANKCDELDQYGEPAEIVFIHAGHRTQILDMDWSPERYLIGSVEANRTMQIWRMSEKLSEERNQTF